MKLFLSVLLTAFCLLAKAQQEVEIGGWRIHQPYTQGVEVAITEEEVYCATRGGLFSYDYEFGSIQIFDRISGLSSNNISCMAYNNELQILILGYEDGNIDLKIDGNFYNISAIKDKNFPGKKNINSVYTIGNFAYLCCGFGIVKLDLVRKEVKETFIIGANGTQVETYQISKLDNFLYVGTDDGLYRADEANSNLNDYRSWIKITSTTTAPVLQVATFANKIFIAGLASENKISYYDGNTWTDLPVPEGVQYMQANDVFLTVAANYRAKVYDSNLELFNTATNAALTQAQHASTDKFRNTWFADRLSGLVRVTEFAVVTTFAPAGPYSASVARLSETQDGAIWAAAGGYNPGPWNPLYNKDGFYRFKNQEWNNFNLTNTDSLADAYDFIVIKENPISKKTYACSWQNGVFELVNDKVVAHFTVANSSLLQVPSSSFVRIGDCAFDSKGSTWFVNPGSQSPVSILSINGTWRNYALLGETEPERIYVDSYDQKWIITRGGKLYILNEANNRIVQVNVTDTKGFPLACNMVVEDADQAMWIATDRGPVIIYAPELMFQTNPPTPQRVKVVGEVNVGYLLEKESINDIAVDGANRKWIATDNGVFLMSADGIDQIHYFTAENSPLLSDKVISIAINQQFGEVFFGTDVGIISYRSTATLGNEKHTNVRVYPNPVRQDYDGPIAVNGLVTNAFIKITDIAGNLVYQTRADGGQLVWDGKDYLGNKAATGVYLIFSMDDIGIETLVSKILFVN